MASPVSNSPASTLGLCPQCARDTLVARHCKLLCLVCGYVESCEDNFPVSAHESDPRRRAESTC